MHHRTTPILTTLLAALMALAGSNASAVDVSDQIELHGYGDIGRT
jgi:hypothetical protein